MDLFSKLSDYEIFGHLTQGFLMMAGVDLIFGTTMILGSSWDIPTGATVVLVAYTGGHLVASPSSLLLERGVVRHLLGAPMAHLLKDRRHRSARNFFFPDYFRPLPNNTREAIRAKLQIANEADPAGRAEDVFFQIYSATKGEDGTRERLSTFLRLYGFCRNSSFVALLLGICLLVDTGARLLGWGAPFELQRLWISFGLLLAAWLLFLRYLKFLRSYSIELTTTFARLISPPLAAKGTEAA